MPQQTELKFAPPETPLHSRKKKLSPSDRRWPLPQRPWLVSMRWHDLLFAHWPVPVGALRRLIPRRVEIDTYDGTAWLGIVPFRMTNIHPRGLPSLPWLSAFPEINVRTYVLSEGKPGVWFLSLDATCLPAIWIARRFYHLGYTKADIQLSRRNEWIDYRSNRTQRQTAPARFTASYRPLGAPERAMPGTFEHWFSARYCLYCRDGMGQVYRGEVDHPPWELQRAEARISTNTICKPLGVDLPACQPRLSYSAVTEAKSWGVAPI